MTEKDHIDGVRRLLERKLIKEKVTYYRAAKILKCDWRTVRDFIETKEIGQRTEPRHISTKLFNKILNYLDLTIK